MSKGTLEEEITWVQRESEKVEALIKSQTEGDQAELSELNDERHTVQQEIEELRTQLNLKELQVKKIAMRSASV